MKPIVVGISYHSAPVSILERLATPADRVPALLTALLGGEHVGEVLVLSTCNRVEVYAGVSAFHAGLTEIVAVLADRAGYLPADLAPYAYVHYEAQAVRHAYRVAAGLDSLVLGEAQILGQLRDAYGLAAENDTAGRLLHELMQQALRVGKRAHAETGIDIAGRTIVSAALGLAPDPAGRSALVIGAGAMGALTLATLNRAGAGPLYVTNRDPHRAARLADLHGATMMPTIDLTGIDLVVSATASPGHVLGPADVVGPVTIIDLAVPRDVDPGVAGLPGVRLIDMATLGAVLREDDRLSADRAAVDEIVGSEVEAFLAWLRGADIGPTVAALRARADEVVTAELGRLAQRRPDLTDDQRADVAHMAHRIVRRLLHSPTVRVRELAAEAGGDRYATLLRELFDLDAPASTPVDQVPEVDS